MNKIGFVGMGRMAAALAGGIAASPTLGGLKILGSDPSPDAREAFLRQVPGSRAVDANATTCSESDVVFLAVKPHQIDVVLNEIGGACRDRVVVSVLAGVRLAHLRAGLPGARVIRVMPNTPCLVGQGVLGLSAAEDVSASDRACVIRWLSATGLVLSVAEPLLDSITGLSGSGPAYVLAMIEAMSDGGVLMGLPRADALQLAIRTVLGTAILADRSDLHPAVLREQVTSPAGTTAAGLLALDQGGFRACVIEAVRKATQRARELAGPEIETSGTNAVHSTKERSE